MASSKNNGNAYAEMYQIAQEISRNLSTPLNDIQRDGKLTHALMRVRQQVIRKIHATGRYNRQAIANFFGLSICTITASLTDDQKVKARPFTSQEDVTITAMYQSGHSIPHIQKHISSRSASSIRRRLAHLKKDDPRISRPYQPSYEGSVSSLMLHLARLENKRMLNNL